MNVNKLVVGLLFLGSIGIGFAQGVRGMGGGGISGQPIDGTTIKPKSIQVSGTADQFVCTSTTATCEVESAASATTMTSTVPAFDIGPTATPGANDRLACFSYGPSGSKTRVACVDAEGDMLANALRLGTSTEGPRLHVLSNNNGDAVTSFNNNHFLIGLDSLSGASSGSVFAQYDATNNRGTIGVLSPGTAWRSLRFRALDWNFIAPDNSLAHTFAANGNQTSLGAISGVSHNSTATSGNQAYTCTNTGCRLSLGNTARYLVDDGTNLEFVAPLQATTFEATNSTGGVATFKAGNATSAAYFQSDTTDAFTQFNTGQESAFLFKLSQDIADTDIAWSLLKSNNGIIGYFQENGNFNAVGDILAGGGGQGFATASAVPTPVFGRQPDGATSVGVILRTNVSYSTAGSKLVSVRNNTSEVSFIDYLGNVSGNGFVATTASGSSLTGGGASGALEITSNTTDAATSGTVPAIRLKATQNITDSDLLLSVEDSAGNRRLTVSEAGTLRTSDIRMPSTGFFENGGENIFSGQFSLFTTSTTIADNGAGTPAAYTQPTAKTTNPMQRYDCQDANGCEVTMSESTLNTGATFFFVNISANNVVFNDSAGVQELAGTATLGQYDTLHLMYSGDRWVEIGRSDN